MYVKLLAEEGYSQALLGLSLSYHQTLEAMPEVALTLAGKDGGHNKFLEAIQVWLDIQAPRYWWQQFDTYRVGITKQSESTMHTLTQRLLTTADFEGFIPAATIERLNVLIADCDMAQLKRELPEAFLQRRVVCLNYKALRNIILQRYQHRLAEWQYFISRVYLQIGHPELLPDLREL